MTAPERTAEDVLVSCRLQAIARKIDERMADRTLELAANLAGEPARPKGIEARGTNQGFCAPDVGRW